MLRISIDVVSHCNVKIPTNDYLTLQVVATFADTTRQRYVMISRDFETIESELVKVMRSRDQSTLKQLFEEVKQLSEEAINQMPEVVYARYLRLVKQAENYSND